MPAFMTKSDVARQAIQELILSGQARAGERITSREISEALGMSETPIREAMRSLSAEGWLDFHPHQGVVVDQQHSETHHLSSASTTKLPDPSGPWTRVPPARRTA